MRLRGTDSRNDALANARNDRLLARAADQTLNVCAHGHARLGAQFDTVLRDDRNDRRLDDLGVNTHLHSLQDVASGKVNRAGLREIQLDIRAARRNERGDHTVEIAAGKVVRFHLADLHIQSGFFGLNQRRHDLCRGNPADFHTHEGKNRNMHAGSQRRNPQPQRNKAQKNDDRNDDDKNQNDTFEHDLLLLSESSCQNPPAHARPSSIYPEPRLSFRRAGGQRCAHHPH